MLDCGAGVLRRDQPLFEEGLEQDAADLPDTEHCQPSIGQFGHHGGSDSCSLEGVRQLE
jgi:hypothetical protein